MNAGAMSLLWSSPWTLRERWDCQRRALLGSLKSIPEIELARRPTPDVWSMIEIVEHLVLAEREVFQGLPDQHTLEGLAVRPASAIRFLMMVSIFSIRIPLRAPSKRMLPVGSRSLPELWERWDQTSAWLKTMVEAPSDALRHRAMFHHPVAGRLSLRQALVLACIHLDTHTRQIRSICRERGLELSESCQTNPTYKIARGSFQPPLDVTGASSMTSQTSPSREDAIQ